MVNREVPAEGSRWRRWWGLLGLASRRVFGGGSQSASRQVALNVLGIALPVALMLVVTSLSLGLTAGTTVQHSDIDYWIVPEAASASSAVVSVDGPQLGLVHAASERINGISGVTYATPVLLELVRLQADTGPEEYVLAVGVVPEETPHQLAGVSTAGLTPGDPHYANGRYDGAWTGEAILSQAAATLLEASVGDPLRVGGPTATRDDRGFAVVGVSRSDGSPMADLPMMVVHLSELQQLTGAAGTDRADQILVKTARTGVKDDLAGVYPRSVVVSRSGLTATQFFGTELPLAIAVTALAVAVVIGALFAASTMGLAIAADRRTRAVLAAVGFSGRSRAIVVAAQALTISLVGGALGVALGSGGTVVLNWAVAAYLIDLPVARFHPAMVAYGLGVALFIGLVTVPYLLVMSRRTTSIQGALR